MTEMTGRAMLGDKIRIAVLGAANPTEQNVKDAEIVGREIAKAGAVVVCGGGPGVMEAVCRGAKAEGGMTIGILPTSDTSFQNAYVDMPIMTGIGFTRNAMMASNGQVAIAVGGHYGTLSEIAFALYYGIPVIGVKSWHLVNGEGEESPITRCDDPVEAVALALKIIKGEKDGTNQ
jgi:uncharacterized protein (TIGR00725 family)